MMVRADVQVYQLKITLQEIEPAIWRRLQVRRQVRLDRLHLMIQAAMGWTNSHLHEFLIKGQKYRDLEQMYEDIDEPDMNNEEEFRLAKLVGEGDVFEYKYDFGDCWQHEILVEDLIEPEPGIKYPRCLAGERACPPEDCGGLWGYEELLEALGDLEHEDYEHYRGWVGEDFDPERFDLKAVNMALRRV
ncbi:MAG: plasmid pRiA4b ORF-3 family protein [Phycisphaerae bacterium]|nr:plasmid pRiA4b ORF-3 family protein [Phycisphaerae bacterium]